MPPGTGDTQITISQRLQLTGIYRLWNITSEAFKVCFKDYCMMRLNEKCLKAYCIGMFHKYLECLNQENWVQLGMGCVALEIYIIGAKTM